MLIIPVRGRLTDCKKAQALVNFVNCSGVCRVGVSREFMDVYPDQMEKYREACKKGLLKPGSLVVCDVPGPKFPRHIIHMPIKESWRGTSTYSAMNAGLIAVREAITNRNLRSLAMYNPWFVIPGMKKDVIQETIRSTFSGDSVTIYLYRE